MGQGGEGKLAKFVGEDGNRHWPKAKDLLLDAALFHARNFCGANGYDVPLCRIIGRTDWKFTPCAFYRPDSPLSFEMFAKLNAKNNPGYGPGINICLPECQGLAPVEKCRLWSWPGNTVDRTPVGVVAHEIGHHVDWTLSEKRGAYFGDYSEGVVSEAKEAPISGYCDGFHEVFAEWFRFFMCNPGLFKILRPSAFAIMTRRITPHGLFGAGLGDWRTPLGANVPDRVVETVRNKIKAA